MSDGYFAQIETSFILNDSRLDALTASQRWMYVVLWCFAVDCHKVTTKMPHLCNTIARLCRIDARSVSIGLTKLCELGLIKMPDNNTITVCGVDTKHPKLKWKKPPKPQVELPLTPHSIVENSIVENSREDKSIVELPGKPAPPKKPPKRKAEKSTSEHTLIIEHWTKEYGNKFKDEDGKPLKYGFDGGKDGSLIKKLLSQFKYKPLKKIITAFFNSNDQFIKHKTGFTIASLKLKANQVAQSIATPATAFDKLSPAGQETARNMQRVLDRMDKEDAENEKIGQN